MTLAPGENGRMKRFLAIYIGKPVEQKTAWNALEPAARQRREADGMRAWMEWGRVHSKAIVDHGTPLGKTKRAGSDGITDTGNGMVAYAIVQAESHDDAAKMFENHPHFSIFPGDSVEIMECLPMPAG